MLNAERRAGTQGLAARTARIGENFVHGFRHCVARCTHRPLLARPMTDGRRCFLAIGPRADVAALRNILVEDGWEFVLPTDVPVGSVSLAQAIQTAIRNADVVLGVLTGEAGEDNVVVFELGVGVALGKPAVLLAAHDVVVPPPLRHAPLVRLAPGAGESLRFALRHAAGAPPPQPETPAARGGTLGADADQFLAAVLAAHTERELVTELRRAFERSGVTVVQEARVGRTRFDLGVWSPELEASVGNPLVIEVKRSLRDPGALRGAIEQVLGYLPDVGGTWAMVLYAEGPPSGELERAEGWAPVLVIRADELLERMREESFAETVRRMRNARAHGIQRA